MGETLLGLLVPTSLVWRVEEGITGSSFPALHLQAQELHVLWVLVGTLPLVMAREGGLDTVPAVLELMGGPGRHSQVWQVNRASLSFTNIHR